MKLARFYRLERVVVAVAFTPKGGCPLKLPCREMEPYSYAVSSINPQGWVPVETSGEWINPEDLSSR